MTGLVVMICFGVITGCAVMGFMVLLNEVTDIANRTNLTGEEND